MAPAAGNHSICGIVCIRKVMKAAQTHDRSTLEEDRSLTSWAVSTLKRCVRAAVSTDANKFGGAEERHVPKTW